MLNDGSVLLQYYLLTLLLILMFGIIGNILISILNVQNTEDQLLKLFVSPLIGLAGFSLSSLAIIRHSDGLPHQVLWVFYGTVLVVGIAHFINSNTLDRIEVKQLIKL